MHWAWQLLLAGVLGLLFTGIGQAQNLVPNGGFEEFRYCPGGHVQLGDKSPLAIWYAATRGTPDLFNACATGDADVPYNWAGHSEAFEGSGYAGLILFIGLPIDYREYLGVELTTRLIPDSTYILEFRYKLASYSKISIDRIHAHLSAEKILAKDDHTLPVLPRFSVVRDSAIVPETGLWELARFEFRATGDERYLTIGNFDNDLRTKTYRLRFNSENQPMLNLASYYYVDNVRLVARYQPGLGDLTATGKEIPADTVITGETYVLRNVLFDFNSVRLKGEFQGDLEKVIRVLQDNPGYRLTITGHTDDQGAEAYNKRLSLNRSETIKSYLMSKGISANRIFTSGKGELEPLVPNVNEEARRINRRTEITFIR